jgi:hypothetical protein
MQSKINYRINAADKILKKEKIATNNPEVVIQGYL